MSKDLSNTIKGLSKIETEISSGSFVNRLATLLNSSIQQRVQKKGLGAGLSTMKPYSKPYSAFKKASGRNTNIRDLTFSGKMWSSLTTESIGSGVRMFFGGTEEAKKAAGNNVRTPFFVLTDKEKAIIKNQTKKLIKT